MIKKISVFTLLLMLNCIYSQAKIIIEYDYLYSGMRDLKSFVMGDQKNAYFFFSNDPKATFKSLAENEFSSVNQYHIYNYNIDEESMYQRVVTYPRSLKAPIPKLGMEKLENLNWKIVGDSKELLGYKVYLATTTFRGRDYKVWFTKDLPYTIFPWKLKGLPGVILEFEDSDGFVRGIAKTITLNSNEQFPNKVTKFFVKGKPDEIVPYKKLISLENEVLQDNMNQAIAALPKGAQYEVPNIRDMALERSFEWENVATKH